MKEIKLKEFRKEIQNLKNQIKLLSEIQQAILEYRSEMEMFPEDYIPGYDTSENERRW